MSVFCCSVSWKTPCPRAPASRRKIINNTRKRKRELVARQRHRTPSHATKVHRTTRPCLVNDTLRFAHLVFRLFRASFRFQNSLFQLRKLKKKETINIFLKQTQNTLISSNKNKQDSNYTTRDDSGIYCTRVKTQPEILQPFTARGHTLYRIDLTGGFPVARGCLCLQIEFIKPIHGAP